MKKFVIYAAALCTIFCMASCASFGSKKEFVPKSVIKNLGEAKKIVVLGYNTSMALDDRLLEGQFKSESFFNRLIDNILDKFNGSMGGCGVSMEETLKKFPVGPRVNTFDAELQQMLADGPFEVIGKDRLLRSGEYKEIKGDPKGDLSFVNAANGYQLTYEFDNWMERGENDYIPNWGSVVNSFKKTLEDTGADLGIIAVQRPYIKVEKPSYFKRWFKKKKPYYCVAVKSSYYIMRPTVGNQILFEKVTRLEAEKKYWMKGYTSEMRAEDEKTFMDQVQPVVNESHKIFIEWLNAQVNG